MEVRWLVTVRVLSASGKLVRQLRTGRRAAYRYQVREWAEAVHGLTPVDKERGCVLSVRVDKLDATQG
jgi:hypothetical protein